jgi:transposase
MKTKKIKYYVGLDVHKQFTSFAVRNSDGVVIKEGECASIFEDIYSNLQEFTDNSVIGIETNTEIYPIYLAFKRKKINLKVANLHKIRNLIGKDDSLDAKRISDMLRLNTFPTSFIPNEKIRELRSLVKARHTIMEECSRLQNRVKAGIRKVGLPSSCKQGIGKYYLESIQRSLASMENTRDLCALIDFYVINSVHLEKITNEMIGFAKAEFPKELEAVSKRKGIGDLLGTYFVSEICPISRFLSAKKLRRYAGVIPVTDKSGGKLYATYLPKSSSRSLLTWAFVQAAHCMIKFDDNIRMYYKKKKREKKITGKAIMAVASSISDMTYKALTSS